MMTKYVLLDDQGEPVRFFDYAHEGAIEIKEPRLTYHELLEKCGEAML